MRQRKSAAEQIRYVLHGTAADPRLWFAGRVIMALENPPHFGSGAICDIGAARRSPTPTRSRTSELRSLAAWYRSLAEKAGDPVIWERRC
jgi:hypothetical protein